MSDLDLSLDTEDCILYFGKVGVMLSEFGGKEYERDTISSLFYQLVKMQNELQSLRRWKDQVDVWIADRPE